MHKKGITEEVAKKRSRRTVKHQRGIVGADLATIAAKRNQTAAVRTQARLAAITKAKTEKKEKESKKAKVRCGRSSGFPRSLIRMRLAHHSWTCQHGTKGLETTDEGWQGWPISGPARMQSTHSCIARSSYDRIPMHTCCYVSNATLVPTSTENQIRFRISTED